MCVVVIKCLNCLLNAFLCYFDVDTSTLTTGEEQHGKVLRYQQRQDQINGILKSKYHTNYSVLQLQLWSRMICTDLHDDMDKPPHINVY